MISTSGFRAAVIARSQCQLTSFTRSDRKSCMEATCIVFGNHHTCMNAASVWLTDVDYGWPGKRSMPNKYDVGFRNCASVQNNFNLGCACTIKTISVYRFSHLFQCKAGSERITILSSCFLLTMKLRIPLIIYTTKTDTFSEFAHRKTRKRLIFNIEILLYIWFTYSSWCQLSFFIFDKWLFLKNNHSFHIWTLCII